jgi:iron complex outermembrane receptor protein
MHNDFSGGPATGSNNEALRLQLLAKPSSDLKIYFESTVGYVHNLPTEYRHIGTYVPGTQGSAAPVFCTPAQAFAGGCVDLFGAGDSKNFWGGSWDRAQYMTSLNLLNQLRFDYTAGSINLTSISAWQYNRKFFPEDSDAGSEDLLAVDYGVHSNTFTQEFRASQNTKRYNWVAGLYYLHENLKQDQPLFIFMGGDRFGGFGIPPGPGAFDGIAQRSFDNSVQVTDTAAGYGQGDYNVGKFTLTLGGRFTWERKTFAYDGSTQFQSGGEGNFGPLQDVITANEAQHTSNFTWRAALTYHLTSHILAYGSAATGFKSGDFNGSFLSNVSQQALLQLQPVAPEQVTAFEIGEKASFFGQRLVFNTALFYNKYKNEQIFASVPQLLQTAVGPIETVTQVLTNAKRAHTQGVEVEVTAVPFRGLTINLQPAWLETRLDSAGLPLFAGVASLDGKQLANAPKFTITGTIEYDYELGGGDSLAFGWNSNYRSHEFFDSTNDPYIQQNAYWLHNLTVAYRNRAGWEIGGFVRNVTNTEYAVTSTDLSNPFGVLTPVIGPPRTYGVQFTFHY